MRTRIASNLYRGLSERLASSGASFLDVGVGVGVIAVGMAHELPALRVVGVDPYAPALALARDRERRRLEARAELREQRGEDIPDPA